MREPFAVAARHVAAALLLLSIAGCGAITGRGGPDPGVSGLDDGEKLAFVIVGRNESGALTVGIDLAVPLSGEEARQAAVDDGVIGEDEDLPNDFYLHNPESTYQLLQFADTPEILMVPIQSEDATVIVTPADLAQLWEGGHPGQAGFYMAPLQPIPMTIVVSGGRIVEATELFLPRAQPQSS